MPRSPRLPRLLMVEDDKMVCETVMLMLENDYKVFATVSVSTALTRLQASDAQTIDVILLDCLLPDGRQGELLAAADQRSIPVVLTSGDPRQADRVDPSRRFLNKPFSMATLLSALDLARSGDPSAGA
jgi:DNA-binding response OmpR family regulator